MFPHIIDLLNSLKATSQLILTFGFSCLHVYMLCFNLLQEKNTPNEYILEKTCKLSYVHVSAGVNTK